MTTEEAMSDDPTYAHTPLPDTYLGDGVYLREDEAAQLWLSTEREMGRLESVALDYYTMARLLEYACRSERWRKVIEAAVKGTA